MATADSMLFSWNDVERLPDLERLHLALERLPDGDLVSALEARRGKGRDDYPVRAMWRALVAGVVFGHESSASLLRELRRNPALLEVCGFDPLGWQRAPVRTLERDADGRAAVVEFPSPRRDGIPTEAAFSRFLSSVAKLEKETGAVSAMAATLRRRLMEALPGFGRHLGYDGKALPSHSTGRKDAAGGKASDGDADWGKHETAGVDGRTGRAWSKVKSWFGYSFHLIADVEHEVPVWFGVERASASEHKALASGVEELFESEPELASRCEDFCADRGTGFGAAEGTAVGGARGASGDRHAGDVAGGESGAGPRSVAAESCARRAATARTTCCAARRARCSAAARRRRRCGRWRSKASRRTAGR